MRSLLCPSGEAEPIALANQLWHALFGRLAFMKTLITEFISLDGVVQAPGGAGEDTDGGFSHGKPVSPSALARAQRTPRDA